MTLHKEENKETQTTKYIKKKNHNMILGSVLGYAVTTKVGARN